VSGPAERDPAHWLRRLSDDEWLASAQNELRHCQETLERRAVRPGVTHARRAAGMAANAVLVLQDNPAWGRSYMEHVTALAGDDAVPTEVRAAAALLRDTPPAPPELVKLGKPDLRALEAARTVVAWARAWVTALRQPAS
jgi:HEPN domain-containing protein